MTQIQATYIDHMGSDLSVVNAARVSFGKKSFGESIEYDLFHDDPEVIKASVAKYKAEGWVVTSDVDDWKLTISKPTMGDTKLIKYLAKHKHISPFGHAFTSFHIKAPIFVARQLVKHKFLRWNEISRRYVDDEPEFYVPQTWRGRSADKKQGSDGVLELDKMYSHAPYEHIKDVFQAEPEKYGEYKDSLVPDLSLLNQVHECDEYVIAIYRKLIEAGVAPEQARMVLPQSTMTEWYWSGSLDAFADMCNLRCKEDTQYETRLVADQVSTIMQDLFPVSWAALMEGQGDA